MRNSVGADPAGSNHVSLREAPIEVLVQVPLPTTTAEGEPPVITAFGHGLSREHVAMVFGTLSEQAAPLVRIHSECLTGDVFASARCDCGPQLQEALSTLRSHGGVLLYMRQEGRGIGLYRKLQAYALQDEGLDTYEANQALGLAADARDFSEAAWILQALGVRSCRLLTNNPDKVEQLQAHGVEVVERVSTGVYASPANYRYLATKKRRALHAIELPEFEDLT